MVNIRTTDLTKSELHELIRKAIRRAWFSALYGKFDCAEAAREAARTLKQELDRRSEERKKLFNLGAEAVFSETGM